MEIAEYFPSWGQLTPEQQTALSEAAVPRSVRRGTVVHNGSMDCNGVLLLRSGQLRAYILNDEGREITVYRLFEMDVCLFSAPCMIESIQFDLTIEAEKDTDVWVIPPHVFRRVMETSAPLANYVLQIMASRLSEIVWLMEQVMWKSFDRRLAEFLLNESALEGTARLSLTHETIAKHMGTAREVVTRMLRHFQSDGLVKLTRGAVELTDEKGLRSILEP